MFWLIISILLVVGTFIGLGFKTEEHEYEVETWNGRIEKQTKETLVWKLRPKQLLAFLFVLLLGFGMFTKIPANNVGIVYSPFHGTKEETLSEGFHGKGLFDQVYKISSEVQTMTVSDLTTQTMDAQYVTSTLDIKYRVSATNAYLVFKQYRTLDRLSESFIVPTTQRILELTTTKYNVIDILGEKRTDIYTELGVALAEEFAKYGVEFYSISITDMDAGEALEKAISDEAVAKKAVETAQQELAKAETEAQKAIVEAKAEQDAAKIQAETKVIEAEAEKKANELLDKSLTDEVLRKAWIDKWNGKMPTYYAGGENGMSIIIDPNENK